MTVKSRKAQDPSGITFEQLAQQWHPLMHKFASWNVRGYDYDDLYQELLIALYSAQKRFNPKKGYAFSTYLHQAFTNRVGSLYYAASGRKRRIPPDKMVSMYQGSPDHGEEYLPYVNPGYNDPGLQLSEITEGLSITAKKVAEYLVGMSDHVFTDEQFADGMAELKKALEE